MSQKQAEANRRNAKRSTGPISLDGKARSRNNAIKHGLGQVFDAQHDARFTDFATRFQADGLLKSEAHQVTEALLQYRRVMDAYQQVHAQEPDQFGMMPKELLEELIEEQTPSFMELNKRERKRLLSILRQANRQPERQGSEAVQRVRRLGKLLRYQQQAASSLSKSLRIEEKITKRTHLIYPSLSANPPKI